LNPDSAVERARECVWPAGWQGATTRSLATCKGEQRSQTAGQTCYRVRSAHTKRVQSVAAMNAMRIRGLGEAGSGQLRI
jgi:hypothetical protein